MNILSRYIEYIRDNPQGYWFKRRLFGWGWTPATWQGWLAMFIYVALIIARVLTLPHTMSFKAALITFIGPIFILTFAFILLAYKKGESPRWQWGIPDKKDRT